MARAILRTVIAFTLCAGESLLGQVNTPEVTLQELGYRVKFWGVDDGLSPGFVFDTIQTPDGYLWVTTLNGLSRFDGHRFTGIHPPDDGKAWFRRPRLQVDDKGVLWIFSMEGGSIVSYENGVFHRWEDDLRKPGFGPYPLWGDVDGGPVMGLWPLDHSSHYVLQGDGEKQFTKLPELDHGEPRYVYQSRSDGTIWILTGYREKGPGLYRITENNAIPVPIALPNGTTPTLETLFRGPSGALHLQSDLGFFTYEKGTWEIEWLYTSGFDYKAVQGVSLDWRGNVWTVCAEGVLISTPDGSLRRLEPRPFGHGMGPPFCDREGSMWIPTRQGLFQFIPVAFTTWSMGDQRNREKITRVSVDGQDRLWFAGEQAPYFLDPGKTIIKKHNTHTGLLSIAGHRTGGAWAIGTNHCYYRLYSDGRSPNSKHFFNETFTLGTVLHQSQDGALWGYRRSGLFQFTNEEAEPHMVNLQDENGKKIAVSQILEDSRERLFAVGLGQGIFKLDDSPTASRLNPEPVQAIAARVDPDDHIWLAARFPETLGFQDSATEEWFFASRGDLSLPDEFPTPSGLSFDLADGLWITSPAGLIRTSRSKLMETIRSGQNPPNWRSFDRRDGLPTIACSQLPNATHLDKMGRLWIPTDSGVAMTDPQSWFNIRDRIPAPEIVLTDVLIDTEPASFNQESVVELSPTETLLDIGFNALHFANPEKVHYKYRLAGHGDRWTEAGNERNARFHKLAPGSYRFEVMADNGYGAWSSSPATLNVVVHPHWWARAEIRIAALLLLLLAGVVLYRKRTSALQRSRANQEAFSQQLIEAQESERKRIAAELHDELGQDLLLIKATADLAAADLPEDSASQNRNANIGKLAQRAINDVRTITSNLRPQGLERLGLATAVRSMCDQAAESSGIEIAHQVDILDRNWDASTQLGIYRILQEGLNNALKHSRAKRIAVLAIEHGSDLDLIVQDDGVGFEPGSKKIDRGMGLGNMRERSKMLNAVFGLTSSPNQGTCLTIRIPTPAPSSNA